MKRIGLLFILLGLISCTAERERPLPVIGRESGLELQPAGFSALKNFDRDDFSGLIPLFAANCAAVSSNPRILARAAIQAEPAAYEAVCRRFANAKIDNADAMRRFLIENFRPYLVMYNLSPQGRFTAYYEAEIRASKVKHGQYRYPIYGRPDDLLEINLQDFDKSLPARRLYGRLGNSKVLPYYTRAEIERHGVNAPVILWGDDPVDIYFMQIQGTASVLLDDGSRVKVVYAGNNGRDFAGIGSILLRKGLIKPGEASMESVRRWLKENPRAARESMAENPRFIFYRIAGKEGAVGALGVPLTPGRSLAVDSRFIPLGSLLWLETTGPHRESVEKLVFAQDTGNAVKGAVRGDYFWGFGSEALSSAGRMGAPGQYYILLPRHAEVKIRD